MTPTLTLDVLEDVCRNVVEPAAPEIDRSGAFPGEGIDALASAGLLGRISSKDVGGGGEGFAEAARIVRRLAAACGSTAMITAMHYSAVAAIEAHGPLEIRKEIAAGRHLSTLAFSETGSRSQFWAPLSSARSEGNRVLLDAAKSWVTSAGHADSYVWTSRPLEAAEGATLWLVPAKADGLQVAGPFDGFGMRGNASSPVRAIAVPVTRDAMLGGDGAGLDIALGVVLPWFQVLNASCSLGLMDAMIARAVAHVTATRYEHLDQTLAQQPLTRQHVARMRNLADAASTMVEDAIAALSSGRADAPLRMLQSKAVAGDAALEVGDLAMRVGGGAAFRKEVGLERHFRDARAAAVMGPTSDALRDFIGRAVCGLPLFGP
jgi:alkylation response protein AidB-like acyl-CoA dehydrogenase